MGGLVGGGVVVCVCEYVKGVGVGKSKSGGLRICTTPPHQKPEATTKGKIQ